MRADLASSFGATHHWNTRSLREWERVVTHHFIPVSANDSSGRRFTGVMRTRDLGILRLTDIEASKSLHYRDPDREHGSVASYMLCLQVEGRGALHQDGRTAELLPGEFSVYDAELPVELEYGSGFRCLALLVPKRSIRAQRDILQHLTAVRMPESSHAAVVFGALLRSFDPVLDSFSGAARTRYVGGAIDVVNATFGNLLGQQIDDDHLTEHERLRLRILDHIEANLGDNGLSPQSICDRFYVSLRTLQALFEPDGGIAATIRDHRLAQCEFDLEQPFDTTPIAAVARRSGFVSASHFSALFRQRTGETPQEYRERHRALAR